METTCKKALCPDRPGEKKIGQATSAPPCERGVPIYPLRYGIADRVLEKKVFPTLSTDGYPALTGGKAYGLRVLRPGTYVYLCYFENGRMWTQHYQVTDDMRFARIWWTRADDNDATPGRLARPDMAGAKPFLLAPESKTAEIVYLMVSETMLTHARLWNIEIDKGGIRTKLATKVRPSGGVEQTHAFNIALVASAAPELIRPTLNGKSGYYKWSEIAEPEKFTTHDAVITGAHIALAPTKGVVPLAVVLHDPIGITSELAHLAAVAAAERQVYEADNNHAYTSAAIVKLYLHNLQKNADSEFYAKRQKLVRYYENDNADRAYGNAMPFMFSYERTIKTKQADIEKRVSDLERWVRTAGSAMGKDWRDDWLSKVFACFDLGAKQNAQDYERVVTLCVGGLIHSEAGRAAYKDLLLAAPEKSPVWLSLAHGIPELHQHFANPDLLKNVLDIGVAGFAPIFQFNIDRPATPYSGILVDLMIPLLADKALPNPKADVITRRLRLFAEIRVGETLVTYRVSSAEATKQYSQFRGEQIMSQKQLRKWGITLARPLRNLSAKVTLFEVVSKGAGKDYISPSPAGAEQKFKLEGNVFQRMLKKMQASHGYATAQRGIVGGEYAITGLAAVSAVMALRASTSDLMQDGFLSKDLQSRTMSAATFLSAISAVLSAGYYIKGDLLQLRQLASGATLKASRLGGALAARTVATRFGAGAAALGAVADVVRSARAFGAAQNNEAGRIYLASAGFGALAAASMLFSTTSVTAVVGGLGIAGPVGWLILAALATGAVVYFSYRALAAKFQPDEVWLAHSFWSRGDARYRFRTLQEELAAFHGAVYGARVVAEWEDPKSAVPLTLSNLAWRSFVPFYGMWQDAKALHREITADGVGTLVLSIVLPGYPNDSEKVPTQDFEIAAPFLHRLRVHRNGKSLKQVDGPLFVPLDYRFPYDDAFMFTGTDVTQNGVRVLTWRITMRADAKVELDYCYRPDPGGQPELALLPQRQPLIFTRGTWLTEPISPSLLDPVKEPQ
ncbi:toxin VasX [Burkholderia cepacia]|uniref:toxin VasX n=1 Tax=Burkholderia cepacia TaxID=292 RepID=UPI001591749B|nr:toxin VasX [Burkholderia cepacia]